MSEDEAFIRAIVAGPGDDLPRLAYADWLDERGDPRGAYLWAELEWAKPWKHGVPPGWPERRPDHAAPPEWELWDWPGLDPLRALAAGLDPLWVARVSRPPIGVCCDHLRFSRSEVEVTPDDIREAEQRLGVSIPTAFAAFLLNHNGGVSTHGQVIYSCGEEGDRSWDWITVDAFCWLPGRGAGPGRKFASLDEQFEELRGFDSDWGIPEAEMVASRFLPVAAHGSGGWLLLPTETATPEGVYELCLGEEDAPRLLVASFPELLARIVTEPV